MKVWRANGSDFHATYETMAELLEYVRQTGHPAAIELDTERFYGHFEGDPQRYRAKGELDRIRDERDALKTFRKAPSTRELLEEGELDAIDQEVAKLIDRAVEEARGAARCDPSQIDEDVYAAY